MNLTSKLSLYDTLTYEVIGCILLFSCHISPATFEAFPWIFFILAFIAGFIFSKLNENGPFFHMIRNSKYFIVKARNKLDSINPIDDNYYRDYYCLCEKKTFSTIKLLEAHIAFFFNIAILIFALLLIRVICPDYYNDTISSLLHYKKYGCFCNPIIVNNIQPSISLPIIIISVQVVLLYIKCLCFKCLCQKQESSIQKKCDITTIDKEKNECRTNRLCFAFFFISLAAIIISLIFRSDWSFMVLLCILLIYLVVKIQSKISYLVVEGAHYTSNINNSNTNNPNSQHNCSRNNTPSNNNQTVSGDKASQIQITINNS